MAMNVIVVHWGNFNLDIWQSPSLLPRRGMGIIQSTSDRIKPEIRRSGPN
jgi:hypothetical protein